MAASPLCVDLELTALVLHSGLPPNLAMRRIEGLTPGSDVFEALSYVMGKMLSEELWEEGRSAEFLFSDPTQWWDWAVSKPTPLQLEYKRKGSNITLKSNDHHMSGWVQSQLCTSSTATGLPLKAGPPSIHGPGAFTVLKCNSKGGNYSGLCEDGPIGEYVDMLDSLVRQGCRVPSNFFYRALKRCIESKNLCLGRRIHALTVDSGYEGDTFLATHLIRLYAAHGSVGEAMEIFAKISAPDAYNWASIIFACAKHGLATRAVHLYQQMRESTIQPDNRIYTAVLKACATAGNLVAGKEVHAHILDGRVKPDVFVQTGLVVMYAKCGSLEDASKVFVKLHQKDVVTWNAMLAGYAQRGMGQEALNLYKGMLEEGRIRPDSVTFVSVLQACARLGVDALDEGKQLHAQIKERRMQHDLVLGCSLVNMYAKCGSLEHARRVFDELPDRDVVTWNAMLTGYAQQGMLQEALTLCSLMQQEGLSPPDSVTFVCLLQVCARAGADALHQGKQLHAKIKEQRLQGDVVLGCTLVNMYAKCGSLGDARDVFDKLPERDVVTWTAMIAGYAQQGMGQEALSLYSCMQQEGLSPPDSVTFVCLLQACASAGTEVGALRHGKRLHAQIEERGLQTDVAVGNSLVNMYAKCGSIEDARKVFDRLAERDVVTWNVMLAGYVQQGRGHEGLSVYITMQQECLSPPDASTFVSALQACAIVAALPVGKQIHARIEQHGMQADVAVGAGLVNMYAKCGSMLDSHQAFDSLPEKSVDAWGALIGGYARQGDSAVVFELLDRMRVGGTQPTDITFVSVLTVCSHAGLVSKGRQYFEEMRTDYGITPTLEHYTCMMDLLGRAGHLNEALQVAKTMPFSPNGAVWHTLLSACWKWKDVEIGQQVFGLAARVDGQNLDAASYVLMSNIYASGHMWKEANEMQARRVKSGVWKKPGQSWWTDTRGVVHIFAAGDKGHPESDSIYARLEQLVRRIKKEGYVPQLDSSLKDVPDAEREAEHSERLAIAYALIKTPAGTTIRVVKNLRVCVDCHTATAYISKLEQRTIICRDSTRFHVFKDGWCSCGDYW